MTTVPAQPHQAHLEKIDAAVQAGWERHVRELAQACTDEALLLMTAQQDDDAGSP